MLVDCVAVVQPWTRVAAAVDLPVLVLYAQIGGTQKCEFLRGATVKSILLIPTNSNGLIFSIIVHLLVAISTLAHKFQSSSPSDNLCSLQSQKYSLYFYQNNLSSLKSTSILYCGHKSTLFTFITSCQQFVIISKEYFHFHHASNQSRSSSLQQGRRPTNSKPSRCLVVQIWN